MKLELEYVTKHNEIYYKEIKVGIDEDSNTTGMFYLYYDYYGYPKLNLFNQIKIDFKTEVLQAFTEKLKDLNYSFNANLDMVYLRVSKSFMKDINLITISNGQPLNRPSFIYDIHDVSVKHKFLDLFITRSLNSIEMTFDVVIDGALLYVKLDLDNSTEIDKFLKELEKTNNGFSKLEFDELESLF